jgi:filamentous hemagglutinin family protein
VGAAVQHSCDGGVDEGRGQRVSQERSTEGISQRDLISTYSWLTKHLMKRLLLGSILLQSILIVLCEGQIILDGSLGPRGPLPGPDYQIGAELGQIRGSNLFHSFDQFSVPTGGSATFTGPGSIDNIIGRVTGGQLSFIDGVLRSRIAGANLFLLNPSGVMFGPNASLAVSGSFHVSTADFLRLADGATFSAHLGQESVLTVAAPAAFGFLGPNPAPITIQGSTLRVREGEALSVVGGDITLIGGPQTVDFVPTLGAEGGRIYLASVASPGEVRFSPLASAPELQVDSFAELGRLELSQGTLVDASGNGGGAILLRSGHLLVDRAEIFADNSGSLDAMGVGVDLRVAADAIIRNGSLITTDRFDSGRARDLQLSAGRLTVDGSGIGARGQGAGTGGNISVRVGTLTLTGGGQIVADTFDIGSGGDITIRATDGISIVGRGPSGESGLFTNTFGSGDAGQITISAPRLTMDGSLIQAGVDFDSRGNAGSIDVQVGQLMLTEGAEISTSTFGAGRGGAVSVVASEFVSILGRDTAGDPSGLFSSTRASGDAGRLFISTPFLSMDASLIEASTFGDGNAGNIEVRGGRLTLTGGAQISTSTRGSGRGGEVTIIATEALDVAGSSGLFTNTFSGGNAGRLFISTPLLTMDDSFIQASTAEGSRGNAGSIEVRGERLMLTRGAQISTSTDGMGRGGDIQVATTHLELSDGGTIASSSSGAGDAGTIRLQVGETFRSEHGRVTTTASRAGGGAITMTVGRLVQLIHSELTTSVRGGGGNAGNLTLDAPFIISESSQIIANAVEGMGGNIRISADVFLADPASRVDASSALGISGIVDIQAPVTSLSGALAPLPQAFMDVAALLPARCAPRLAGGKFSSLVVGGREGLPLDPGGILPSPLTLDGRQTPPARGALLAVADKVFPRMRGTHLPDGSVAALGRGCLN